MRRRTMRIGVITPEYPPYAGGGIGTATVSFVNNMAGMGHIVDVFAIFRPDIPGYDSSNDKEVKESNNINIHYLSYKLDVVSYGEFEREVLDYLINADINLAKAWIMSKKLHRFLEANHLDIIFSAEYMGLSSYFLLEQRSLPLSQRTPLILTLHTGHRELNYANYLSTRNIRNWERGVVELEQLSIDAATLLHSPSKFLSDFIKQTYFVKQDIHIVPYFDSFLDAKSICLYNPDYSSMKRILFVGRMERRKGYKEFISSALLLLKTHQDYKFIVAGGEWHDEFTDKSYSAEVQRLIPDELMNNFEFKGMVPHKELPALIASVDVVIVPSLFENYPNTCIEAAQMGIPVLISGSGGMKEIVGDHDFTVFNPFSVSQMSQTIESFLNLSTENKRVIIEKQRQFYSNKHLVDGLVSEYEALMDKAIDLHANSLNHEMETSKRNAIGIGIPVFNTGQYLDECIESIISQTRAADRILIINDGSTDKHTLDKLQEWSKKEPMLEIVHQDNMGLCATRNRIIETFSKEDFFLMLDSDDVLHHDYLKKTEIYLTNNPQVSAVTTWVKTFEEVSSYWTELPFKFPKALFNNMIISSVALIRRASIPSDLKYNEKLSPFTAEDWDFWIAFHKHGLEIGLIPEPLFNYRVRKNSKFNSLNFRKYAVIIDHLLNTHEDIYRKYMKDVMAELFLRNYIECRQGNFWARLANRLPGWLLFLLRKNAFIKNIGYRLLTKGS